MDPSLRHTVCAWQPTENSHKPPVSFQSDNAPDQDFEETQVCEFDEEQHTPREHGIGIYEVLEIDPRVHPSWGKLKDQDWIYHDLLVKIHIIKDVVEESGRRGH